LQQLTNAIRGHLPYLRSAQKSLTIFDFIQAKSRVALDLDANLPTISDEPLIDLVDAFHPILFRNNRAKGKKTLPQTLKIDTQHRILVISGPNAGGKSITMKTIGLLQAMFQSGMLVPVHERSQMSILSGILTDIGDNQSIENQLSTYSYRLRRMKHFLEAANRRSLVLLDEFGTGSDPDLGGALAEVFFEALYRKKSFGVITTHYANIKLKAAELPHAINGCMLFDTASLLPLYQLSLGQPGSSFTFEVAEMNGIPKELIADAKKKLSRQKVKMDELLSSLQEEKNRYSKMSKDAEQAASVAGAAIEDFERMKLRFETKLQKQQESIEKNNKFMVLGKKMDGFIAAWNPRKKNADVLEEVKKFIVVEKNKIEDHRKEEAIKRQVSKEKKIQEQADYQLEKIQPGSLVKLEKTRQTGTVMSIENQEAIVAFGHFKTRVDLKKLIFIQ
jgi:DNA mismatch repair protein MutS2